MLHISNHLWDICFVLYESPLHFIYGAKALSGPWPPSQHASFFLCLLFVHSIFVFLVPVACPYGLRWIACMQSFFLGRMTVKIQPSFLSYMNTHVCSMAWSLSVVRSLLYSDDPRYRIAAYLFPFDVLYGLVVTRPQPSKRHVLVDCSAPDRLKTFFCQIHTPKFQCLLSVCQSLQRII
jgi:hypothetical protein